ncbi:hypothetical protein AN191_08280 [Loktanella sp. 5RATIMAR09]|nr:hypothetical protein AN191_08280 [Loktanella sp. 5RATIMAR09]
MEPTSTLRSCICIKWGQGAYTADDVNRLYTGLKHHSRFPVRLYCVTDDPSGILSDIICIPLKPEPFDAAMQEAARTATKKNGALKKIGIFRPGLIPELVGPLLFVDLDIVITNDIGPLFDFAPGMVCMAPPFGKRTSPPTFGEGSVIRFDPSKHGFLYHEMADDPAGMVTFCGGSEQSYTSGLARKYNMLANYPKSLVVSFKRQCCWPGSLTKWFAPRLPRGATVVCFHGHPKAAEALSGHHEHGRVVTLPADWLTKAWDQSTPAE